MSGLFLCQLYSIITGIILCICIALRQPVIVKSALDNDEKKLAIPKVEIAWLLYVPDLDNWYKLILVLIHWRRHSYVITGIPLTCEPQGGNSSKLIPETKNLWRFIHFDTLSSGSIPLSSQESYHSQINLRKCASIMSPFCFIIFSTSSLKKHLAISALC